MKNSKGFTLVELIVTIVLLAIVAGIGTFTITNIIKTSKDKNYRLLIKNIISAAEAYYQECEYSGNYKLETSCSNSKVSGKYILQLKELVSTGFLVGNDKDNEGNYQLVDPRTNKDIGECTISFYYNSEADILEDKYIGILVESGNEDGCPTNDDFSAVDYEE